MEPTLLLKFYLWTDSQALSDKHEKSIRNSTPFSKHSKIIKFYDKSSLKNLHVYIGSKLSHQNCQNEHLKDQKNPIKEKKRSVKNPSLDSKTYYIPCKIAQTKASESHSHRTTSFRENEIKFKLNNHTTVSWLMKNYQIEHIAYRSPFP